jgi:membrane-associated phospholipid phosphatase
MRRQTWAWALMTVVGGAVVFGGDLLPAFDVAAAGLLGGYHPNRAMFVRVQRFSGLAPYYGAGLVILGMALAYRRRADPSAILGVLLMLAVGLAEMGLLKLLFPRTRPPLFADTLRGESFPSGHTANMAMCVGAALHLIQLARPRRDGWWWATAVVGLLVAVAVALSRVYLARHWATDVTASLAFGFAFWALAAPRAKRGQAIWVILFLATSVAIGLGVRIPLPSPALVR